jgi:hypothetical protein
MPVWASVALILVLEIGVALVIRDNLTLNIIMLLHPIEAIKAGSSEADPRSFRHPRTVLFATQKV